MQAPIRKFVPHLALAALLLTGASVPALADEAAVKQRLEQRLPTLKVDQISTTPFAGLYEIYAEGALLYTDEDANYLIQGSLIDTKSRQNLSSARLRQLTAITFDQLPLSQAIKIVKGNGKRQMAVFEDPDCPFCRQLEQELGKVDNVTVHVFLYPIEQLHRGSTEKSRKIWCAEDRAQAWRDATLKGVSANNPGNCDTPLEKLADFGRRLRITGTPTLFFADGNRISGMIPAGRIEQLLGSPEPATTPARPAAPTM